MGLTMRTFIRAALLALALVVPAGALAATEAGQPFPTNLYTVADATQITGLHVDLPMPPFPYTASVSAPLIFDRGSRAS